MNANTEQRKLAAIMFMDMAATEAESRWTDAKSLFEGNNREGSISFTRSIQKARLAKLLSLFRVFPKSG
jgi:hypothetical protein